MKAVAFLCVASLALFSCVHADRTAKELPPPARPVEIPSPIALQSDTEKRIAIDGREERYSFSLREADIKDVMRAVAKQTDYNVVVEPEVKGIVTVDLKNVSLRKALDYILEPLEYNYTISDRTIYVSKPRIETRVFVLNYIAIKKTGASMLRGSINLGSGGAGGTTATGTTGTTTGTAGAGTGRATEVLTMKSDSETDMWKDLETHIKEMLSKDGKYILNRLASTIVVSDMPRHLKNVALYLESIQNIVQRQVMIEAKIIEVQLNEAQREGVNWRVISARIGEIAFDNTELVTRAPSMLFPITKDAIPVTTDLGAITGQSPNILTPPFFRFGVSNANFESFIELLREQGKVKVISSPKIATLNNQRAIIKVAREDVAFETTTTIASGSPSQTSSIVRYVTIGLMLDVMPQIDNKGNIILNVHPVITEKVRDATSKTGDASAPVIDVRETDTVVRMKDGETLIIGGLIKDREYNAESGVPGLMNLPIIGKFFRSKDMEKQRNELVIFLTPRIIYSTENL